MTWPMYAYRHPHTYLYTWLNDATHSGKTTQNNICLLQKPLKYVFSKPNENFNHRADFLIPQRHNWDGKKDHIFVHVLPRDIAIVYKRMLWFIKAELHIHASVNLAGIGSDNGLSPGRCQAIIWTNAGSLWIGPLRTTFNQDTTIFS